MKQLLTIFLSFLCLIAMSQSDTVFMRINKNYNNPEKPVYEQDTFINQSPNYRNIILGTSVVNSLKTYMAMNNYGFDFYKVDASGCNNDGSHPHFMESEIITTHKSDSLLITEVTLVANCGYSFLCEIEIVNDSTLNLIANGYGTYYSCDCCHNLKYSIKLNKSYDTDKIEYYMINGDEKTITAIKNKR